MLSPCLVFLAGLTMLSNTWVRPSTDVTPSLWLPWCCHFVGPGPPTKCAVGCPQPPPAEHSTHSQARASTQAASRWLFHQTVSPSTDCSAISFLSLTLQTLSFPAQSSWRVPISLPHTNIIFFRQKMHWSLPRISSKSRGKAKHGFNAGAGGGAFTRQCCV